MDLENKLAELSAVVRDHREVLATEEAAKNALVMPFLQAIGYNVFNPSEVVPEFTCDVGTKKGEKVDYAIRTGEQIVMLVECKPAKSDLTISNASQLFRYFSVTDSRVAILTNGVIFKFYSDIDTPNKMDDKPFFTLDLDSVRPADVKTLAKFTKENFDIENIVSEASNLKIQSLVAKALKSEFDSPSEDFVRLIASQVHEGRLTPQIKDLYQRQIVNAISSLIREKVNDRLNSALDASNPIEAEAARADATDSFSEIETTQDEIDGFNIIRGIGSRLVGPSRIVMRDAKSYCAVLLDDNNRKTIARLHFNSDKARYLGCFQGKEEVREPISNVVDIYSFESKIVARINELEA